MRDQIAAKVLRLQRVAVFPLAEADENDALVAAVAGRDEIEPVAVAALEARALERAAHRTTGAPVELGGAGGQHLVVHDAGDHDPALGDGVFGEFDVHAWWVLGANAPRPVRGP
jgi:hypothetical protein